MESNSIPIEISFIVLHCKIKQGLNKLKLEKEREFFNFFFFD